MPENNLVLRTVVVGAGGLGCEVAATIQNYLHREFELMGFVDDGVSVGTIVNDLPVLGGVEWLIDQENLAVVLAIGSPKVKQIIYNRIKSGSFQFPNIIHPNSRVHDPKFVKMGIGNIITDACIITTNVNIGNFNLLNLACTVGHDTQVGDFCSIMPTVSVSGGATIRNNVYVGTGAKLIKATTLNDSCTVGAGAVVNTDIPEGKTFAGVPAKELLV